jgi:hypothetical protein
MLTGKYFSAKTLLIFILFLLPSTAFSQFVYDNEPAISVLTDIQEKSEFRFLYRESLLADIRLSLNADKQSIIDELKTGLSNHNLRLKADLAGSRFLVLPQQNTGSNRQKDTHEIRGQIVDSQTGDRLPYGTISWKLNGLKKGVSASGSGDFSFDIPLSVSEVTITASYVGYQKESITLNINNDILFEDVTFRLSPEFVVGSEIIVTSSHFYTPQDSTFVGLIRTDRFSPLGDGNAVRALQILPSVQPATAINDGLSIRGSAPDGFHLELDGMKIFNQSHLFGLLDSFNEDAIRNSGFYYGIAPAHEHAPAGGKLQLTTKNGSVNQLEASAGISNTSIRATLHGPVRRGKSSWLFSGRLSTMDELQWFNNDKIIQWGLDVNRPRSEIENREIINSNLVTPLASDVRFFDIHGKFYSEASDGSRTIFSAYFGGDRTSHAATRITSSNSLRDRFEETDVETSNQWNNFASSVKHQRFLRDELYSNTLIGISAYETTFSKEDFIYTNFIQNNESIQTIVFTSPLSNQSTMNRLKINQTFDFFLGNLSAKAGLQGIYHLGEYLEESFDRPRYYKETSALQTDVFAHIDWQPYSFANISAGIRTHYYSNGNYIKGSPRLSVRFFDNQMVSAHAGYSKNHQFINRISFKNAVTADLWILADTDQPPTSADQFTAGLEFKPFSSLLLKTDFYKKNYRNLRLHELNTSSLSNTVSETPWYYQNSGDAVGLETMVRLSSGIFSITQTHTYSSIKLQNDLLNGGEEFYAPWDRRHSFGSLMELSITQNLSLFASYTASTGTIDTLPERGINSTNTRLPNYHRLDLSANYLAAISNYKASFKFSIFNVTDRQNTWYREYQPVIFTRQTVPAIRAELVDVYDLGIQPSFEIKLIF